MPQNIYIESCKCIWQIFTLALCNCKKIYIYIHCNRISVNVKYLDM
jgi:hypothetical protein